MANVIKIKVEALSEVSGEKESVTEIQNYLDTFNKEIEGGDPSQHNGKNLEPWNSLSLLCSFKSNVGTILN